MFQLMWVVFVFQGTKTPGLFRLQCNTHPGLLSAGVKWAEMLHNPSGPCILGAPQQRGQNQSTKSNKIQK